MSSLPPIPLVDSLRVLHAARGDAVVITAMGAAREWMTFPSHPLDFIYVPSSMGQAPSLGLGMALARPDRRIIVCHGDGSTLMNIGALVTITAEAPPNLCICVFDNGVYEVTGAQATAGTASVRRDQTPIDFAAVAKACGFKAVLTFDRLDRWRAGVDEVLSAQGPVFAWLKVAPVPGAAGPKSPGPAPERARRFAAALAPSNA